MRQGRRAAQPRKTIAFIALLFAVFGVSLALSESQTNESNVRNLTNGPAEIAGTSHQSIQRHAALHIKVNGLGISEDVALADKANPNFYLSHDLEGNPSNEGAAFLDYRVTNKSRQALIYGHNLTGSSKMFSPLRTAWTAQTFRQIQGATLINKSGKEIHLVPLFARRVDSANQQVQKFEFTSDADFTDWLGSLGAHSEIKAMEYRKLLKKARSCVCLITCASVRPHQGERTLVIFVPERPCSRLLAFM